MEVFFLISHISSKSLDFSRFAQSLSVSLCPTGPRQDHDFLSVSSGNAGSCLCMNLREECACSKKTLALSEAGCVLKICYSITKGGH